jgi:hypothetical protein
LAIVVHGCCCMAYLGLFGVNYRNVALVKITTSARFGPITPGNHLTLLCALSTAQDVWRVAACS